jgi:hypothetical protein
MTEEDWFDQLTLFSRRVARPQPSGFRQLMIHLVTVTEVEDRGLTIAEWKELSRLWELKERRM